jgi:hypothetical protein
MDIHSLANQTAEDLSQLKVSLSERAILDEAASVRSWLLPNVIDPETDFDAASKLRHPLTGSWFLESDTFCHWLKSKNGFLWIYGIRMLTCHYGGSLLTIQLAGCGKTVLS